VESGKKAVCMCVCESVCVCACVCVGPCVCVSDYALSSHYSVSDSLLRGRWEQMKVAVQRNTSLVVAYGMRQSGLMTHGRTDAHTDAEQRERERPLERSRWRREHDGASILRVYPSDVLCANFTHAWVVFTHAWVAFTHGPTAAAAL